MPDRLPRFWGGAAIGLGLGVSLTYAWASLQHSPQSEPETAVAVAPVPPDPASLSTSTDTRASADSNAAPLALRPPAPAHRAAHGKIPAAEVAELNRRVVDLTKELNRVRDRLAADTSPMSRPADLPERFSQPAIIAAITSALREVRSGAQLSSVDCTEYPCIAYFQTLSDKDLQLLKQSRAYEAYANDRFRALGRGGADGPFDAVVVWPDNDPNPTNEFRARLRYRMGQMFP